MKKISALPFAALFTLLLSVSAAANQSIATIYAPDGRTLAVPAEQVDAYENVGWYGYPVSLVYAPDGRSLVVPTEQVDTYKNVGWYGYPVSLVYAPDGRSLVVPTEQVDTYKNVGWYGYPVSLIYAPDGRSLVVPTEQVDTYKSTGWYSYPVTVVYSLDGRSAAISSDLVDEYKNVGWYTSEQLDLIVNHSCSLNFNCVLQNPELPTGCEVTALTAALHYYGFDIDKVSLAVNYLDKGPIGSTSPYEAFVGSPHSSSSYGCFAPVIVNCANKYLTQQGSSLRAYNTTGTDLGSLFLEVAKGKPVIIWATMYMRPSYLTATWRINGQTIRWIAREHCMVLYGYDKDRQIVKIADPLVGNVEYSIPLFEKRFHELLMQSVIIQ